MRVYIIVILACAFLGLNARSTKAEIAAPPPKKMCGEWEPVYGTWTFHRQVPFQEGWDRFNADEAAIGSDITITVHETSHSSQSWNGWRLHWTFEGTATTNTGMTGVYSDGNLRVYDAEYDEPGQFAYGARIDWANGYKDEYLLPASQDTTAKAAHRNPQYVVLDGTYGPDSDMGVVPDGIRDILNPDTFSSLRIPFHCVREVDESTLKVTALKDRGRIADIPKIDTAMSAVEEMKGSHTGALPLASEQAGDAQLSDKRRAANVQSSKADLSVGAPARDESRLPADASLRMANSVGPISTGGFAGPAYSKWMAGSFDTDFGLLTLTTEGGSYSHNNGRVTVTRRLGPLMEGVWQEASGTRLCSNGSYHGRFKFEFTSGGFVGAYTYCDESAMAGRWNGTRKS